MPAVEIGIVTADGEKLAEFYIHGLGFSVEHTYDFPRGTVRRLARGHARCKLFQPAVPLIRPERAQPWYTATGIRYGALLVDDADAEVAGVQAAGGQLLEGVISHRPGARYALISDPEGNIWEILEEH